jgi:uncharacterized protein YciI
MSHDPTPAAQWYALEHRPGPALAEGESVFDHPGFAEHVRFQRRLMDGGLLVASGPLTDDPGAGMTVIRTPGTPIEEVEMWATRDDLSVANGVLSVRVRPWNVLFSSV